MFYWSIVNIQYYIGLRCTYSDSAITHVVGVVSACPLSQAIPNGGGPWQGLAKMAPRWPTPGLSLLFFIQENVGNLPILSLGLNYLFKCFSIWHNPKAHFFFPASNFVSFLLSLCLFQVNSHPYVPHFWSLNSSICCLVCYLTPAFLGSY